MLLFHRRHNCKTNSVSIWPNDKVVQLKLMKLTQRQICHRTETKSIDLQNKSIDWILYDDNFGV